MTYTLFELAQNPDIQTIVRNEINDICCKYGNDITYDGLLEMSSLDRVIYGELDRIELMSLYHSM